MIDQTSGKTSLISDFGGEVRFIRRYLSDEEKAWSVFNPSIMLSNEEEYWLAFRSSNYILISDERPALTAESKIRNRMFIARLNPDWDLEETTLKEIDIKTIRPEAKRGIEDPRLFWDGNGYCISSTYVELDQPVPRISTAKLKSLEDPEVTLFDIKYSPMNQIEKNWMPIHKTQHQSKTSVEFIYDSNSVIDSGIHRVTEDFDEDTSKFRGGTQLIPLGDGTSICLIHQTYYYRLPGTDPTTFSPRRTSRKYKHRFVQYDKNYRIIAYSDPFVFVDEGIEFAAGIAPYKDGFVISFGRSDVSYYIATISKNNLVDSLRSRNV